MQNCKKVQIAKEKNKWNFWNKPIWHPFEADISKHAYFICERKLTNIQNTNLEKNKQNSNRIDSKQSKLVVRTSI